MSEPRILATYRIETLFSLEEAAESMAGEQSTGTFARVEGETDQLRQLHLARVESITELEPANHPALPSTVRPEDHGKASYARGEVRISFPLSNIGPNLPTLFTTVAGNLYELRQLSGLRLLDVEFPQDLSDFFSGPPIRYRGNASSRPSRRSSDPWDDCEAECRFAAGRDSQTCGKAGANRHRLYQR